MNKLQTWLTLCLLAILLMFAIKPRYGGTLTIRLNEPASFLLSGSTYSNLVFYSLIYENLFYQMPNGQIHSNLFSSYQYNSESRSLTLELKDDLCFSGGQAISINDVTTSLKLFREMELTSAVKFSRNLKGVRTQGNQVVIELQQDNPDILYLMSAPELVLMASGPQTFSGPFFPAEWNKGRQILLQANPNYPGGRPYLDQIRVNFENTGRYDLFLSGPGQTLREFKEWEAGIFQNIYLIFPQGGVGINTKTALFTLMNQFNDSLGKRFSDLHSLTTDQESPVSINISTLPADKVFSILRTVETPLYIISSLNFLDKELRQYLETTRIRLETIYIDDTQLKSFQATNPVKYVLIDKVFQKKSPPEEKIIQILKEFSFIRYNEKYLNLWNELEEIKTLPSRTLLIEQLAKINEAFINDGMILPLFQKKFSLYAIRSLKGMALDISGRPILAQVYREE